MQDLAPDTEAADAADVELVRRMSDGESAALDALFSRHAGRVNGLLLRMLGSSGEAEEALQDVFLQAWTRASTFRRDKGTPRAWLMVIARSRALDRLRSGRAARRRDEEALRETPLVAEADAELAVERRELGASMRRLLGELPAEQRQAIELAFFAGLTHSECAERLGVPLGTLKSRILMGMKKLKQGLDTYRGRR
ncbi:MAG TPA: sigma-70 family RNA polymerase sigma factor, partial [Thermoanaerobaculia bacterium]|nr:sigma-70 family RNA polymerase sigma factor [Thermoanaerobaculia bacterium]